MGLPPTPQRVEKEYKMPLLVCGETEHEGDHGSGPRTGQDPCSRACSRLTGQLTALEKCQEPICAHTYLHTNMYTQVPLVEWGWAPLL